MATVTKILSTDNVAQFSLVGKTKDFLIANQLASGNKVVKIDENGVVPFVVPKGQTFTAGAVSGNKVFCSVLAPRKPQFAAVLEWDGSIEVMDAVPVKKASVFPFWADDIYVLATVADGTTTKRTADYTFNGTLSSIQNAQVVGRNQDEFVFFEQDVPCPEGFSMANASRASGNVTIGQMYLNDKRSGVNACSWAEIDGRYVWMVPNGALGCDRFSAKSFTSDGSWVFGLAYEWNASTPFQVDAAFDTVGESWHSLSDLFGVDLSFADLVIDGDVVYGRAADGIYKVEGWK